MDHKTRIFSMLLTPLDHRFKMFLLFLTSFVTIDLL